MNLFYPIWEAILGPVTERGTGLLGKLNSQKPFIDEFRVVAGTFVIRVLPKKGQIFLDSNLEIQMHPSELVWFRRMEKQIATMDKTSRGADCLWYGVGLECNSRREGFKLYCDGRLKKEPI